MILKAYKYRLYPTDHQAEMIDKSISICRLIYNIALQTKIWAHESGVSLSAFDLGYQLVDMKKDYVWMNYVDSQALVASIRKVDIAFKNFFSGKGFPRFKSRKDSKQSFQCPCNTRRVNWETKTLTVPKIYDIPIVLSRKFNGEIKTITISKTATNKYFASILVETKDNAGVKNKITPTKSIGIDVGIKNLVVTSNGKKYDAGRKLKINIARLSVLQKRHSRKVRGSNNKIKSRISIALLHEKIVNQRKDYIHKVTNDIIGDKQADSIFIEDLNIAGMVKNRKLSLSISDASFGELFRQLSYKCDWYGKNLTAIGRFDPSTKRCSECGEVNSSLTLADREWVCECGAHHDRDINAAKNILWYGLNKEVSPEGIRVEPVELRRVRRIKKQENKPIGGKKK